MKQNFQNASMQQVEMGDAATAYVFFPEGDRATMNVRPDNVQFRNSSSDFGGNTCFEVDMSTKSPEDCAYEARDVVAGMKQDAQPKVVVFVHEPHRFHFNDCAVARQVQAATQKPQGFFAAMKNYFAPKGGLSPA